MRECMRDGVSSILAWVSATWESFRVSQYLVKFRGGEYDLVIDHARYGLSGTYDRMVRLFPDEVAGMIHANADVNARIATRTLDIRFLK